MTARTKQHTYRMEIEAPANGRVGKATITLLDEAGKVCHTDKADLSSAPERQKVARRIAEAVGIKGTKRLQKLQTDLEQRWHDTIQERRRVREQAAAGSPEAASDIRAEIIDTMPLEIRRPLTLIGGRGYAAAWCSLRVEMRQTVDSKTGEVRKFDPPLVQYEPRLLIVRDDGEAFADSGVPNTRPIGELGLPVRLHATVAPRSAWSGAGLKRFLAGERPVPADLFAQLFKAVNHFLDFSRSLTTQEIMCELVAAYILATWLLEAFNIVGYLWPNGEPGSGKTTLLQLVAEAGYLGELILAGSTYPTLRDLADYGATLCFDDAEAVMDTRRTDPDKRTLLLAGNRRGATVAVREPESKDRWVTRHVHTFCPRLFSAIRLPDPVLGSRSIIVPLIRSGDAERTKRSVADPETWPCDRRRLLDDLWAFGLAHLHELAEHDRQAANKAWLAGRALEPWRAVLAVAHWLQEKHGQTDLFKRLEELSVNYQQERGEYEEHDSTRVLFRALLALTRCKHPEETVSLKPAEIARSMNQIAKEEDLAEADRDFTNSRKVGWLMKRQRFRRGGRKEDGKQWDVKRGEVEAGAKAHGVEDDTETASSDDCPF